MAFPCGHVLCTCDMMCTVPRMPVVRGYSMARKMGPGVSAVVKLDRSSSSSSSSSSSIRWPQSGP